MKTNDEKETWLHVRKMLGNEKIELGRHWSYNLFNDPKRLAFVLSRYKFAAKMACHDARVLELGCSEGIGAPILSEFAKSYTGVDFDSTATNTARTNWESDKCHFIEDDFLGKSYGEFDALVSMDVIEHIHTEYENLYIETIAKNLCEEGVCVIGTPNITSDCHASPASRAGHVNLFDGERLKNLFSSIFHNVFLFGVNDEVVHTGYSPMAHFLVVLGCYKKTGHDPKDQKFTANMSGGER